MKKVLFTSILLLSAVSFGGNIYAQDTAGGNDKEVTTHSATQPSVTFTADGNTLTISGQGDLTSYTTTDWSAKVFTDKAVNNVFTGAYAAASVSANDSYNAANTYYRADYVYSLLESGIPSKSGYFTNINNVSTWKKTADISNLYAISYVNTTNGSHMIGMAKKVTSANTPDLTRNWSYGELANQAFYIISDEDISDKQLDIETLEQKGYKTISLVEFCKEYVDVSATYSVWNSGVVFVKHANSESYESLQTGKTYNYVDGDAFYTATVSFVKIDNNATFFAENAEYLKKDPKPFSVAQLTLSKIQQGDYENVVFKNESSAEPLLIDAAIIRSILYPNNGNANTALKNVDFGEATVNAFDELTFAPTDGYDYIPGHLNITKFTLPLTKKSSVYSENKKANVEKMVLPSKALGKMSGNTIQNVVIPEGYERLGNEAFDGCSHVKNFTFPKSLQVIGDRAFYSCNDLREIEFNEGLENIGKEAFMGNSLVSVKFPSTLRIINDAAFATASKDPHITNIKLNAGLKYIGNSAFALENDESEGVLEIPASVRYIGPFAFNFRQYQDVYFYGETAPLMPLGLSSYKKDWGEGTGFSEHTLDGNSGFQPLAKSGLGDDINTGYANRENYKNGKAYFCIMHYPKSLSDKDRSTYTDIKRQYKTDPDKNQFHKDDVDGPDGTKGADIVGQEQGEIMFGHCTAGKRVNWGYQDTYLGEQYIWPSQAQFTRAYATASNGLCWDGVTKYPADDDIESYLTEDDIATLEYAGYKIGNGEGEYSKADLAKLAHIGTRQFVLANADSNVDKDEEKEPEYNIVMKPGQWWTLCVPFNMTRKQVLDTFGADTQLYFFYQVERHTTDGKNSILLKFTKDALNYSSTDGEGNKMKGEDGKWLYEQMEHIVDDNEVVIWAHESYMIKPMNGQDSDKDATFVVQNYAPVVGNPLPTIVDATGTDQLQNDDYSKEYRFVGNYLGSTDNNKVVIPQYSYVYGKTTKDPTYKFRFYTGKTSVWKPNKSLVQSQDRQGGLRDYNNFFGADKSSTLPTSAKQASIFGEENFGETTGIDDVTIIAGNEVLTPIFTLDGKMVSANGSVDGLAKGVYVKAGKKFVVK
uniref:leucine-rich repeat domain-containing protein n=1 Tax=Prevotella sp. TaxID=59823 RepID=UPI004026B3D1